jgi:hypothetical protein
VDNLKSEVIDFLIDNACTSISIRTKREISKKIISIDEETLIDEKVKLILNWQMADGYFGNRLHTPSSKSKTWAHEGCVRYLLEKGFSLKYKPLKKSLDVLCEKNWEKEFIGSKAGQILGCEIIRASLFSQAGMYDNDFVREYIKKALASFEFVANANGFNDIATQYKNKYIYINGKCLPVIYDLRILAFTFEWRTKNNIEMLSKAYKNLYKWLPFPPTYIKASSQLVAPFGPISLQYNSDYNETIGFPWFDFYELSARMGILTNKSPFYKHFEKLYEEAIKSKGDIFKNIDKKGFLVWSSYSGLALEVDWTKKQRKINDILFRCCLIESLINS